MDSQHNWLSAQVAEGEAASSRIDEKAGALREEWFKIGHAFLAAKQLYPSNQAFGEWLRTSPLRRWSDEERSCSTRLAENEAVARAILEGTDVASARRMWERVAKVLSLTGSASLDTSKDEPNPISEPQSDINPPENTEIGDAPISTPSKSGPISPRPATQPRDLEKTIGPEDAAYIRGWFSENRPDGKRPLVRGVSIVDECKPILDAIATAVKSGDCVHADVASLSEFDLRMAFPHIPKALASMLRSRYVSTDGKKVSWQKLNAKKKNGKSDWERLAELNEICKGKSSYTVEKPAPNGTYQLREKRHEDDIGHGARQWWHSGHWPGDTPKLTVFANQAPPTPTSVSPASNDAAIYYGMQLWPFDTERDPNSPTTPTKTDVDNTYWFVEELARALRSRGHSHTAAARYIRNWSKYIGQLQRPAAAASLMQDMAQGLDTRGDDEASELKNRMPSRPIKFAKEG